MALGNKDIMAKNISYYMNLHSIDRNKLCSDLELPYMTVSDWINGKTYPRIDKIELLANYFKIKKSDLIEEKPTTDTKELTDKYIQLQPPRQKIVLDTATTQLEEQKAEEKKLEELKAKKKKQEENKTTKVQAVKEPATTYKTERKRIRLKTYPFLLDVANAGNGHGDEYQYVEGMKAPFCDGADFIMKVSGDSMYPTFEHGDYVYIQKTIDLYPGDIGIFLGGNTYYIKEYSNERLISHNREFDDIYPDEFNDIYKIGKVLGKVDFDI